MDDWRSHVAWPVPYTDHFSLNLDVTRRIIDLINALPHSTQRMAATLVSQYFLGTYLHFASVAIAEQKGASDIGLFSSQFPVDEIVSKGSSVASECSSFFAHSRIKIGLPRFPTLRRLARTASWSSPLSFTSAAVAPDFIAVSHNAMLKEAAKGSGHSIGFHQAEAFLLEARRKHLRPASADAEQGLVAALADAACYGDETPAPVRPFLNAIARRLLEPLVGSALSDLEALSSLEANELPRSVWSGTGGAWAPRVVGLEVMRRGGRVRRFDHGGGRGFENLPEMWHLTEFAVSTDFTSPTEVLAARLRYDPKVNGFLAGHNVTFHGGRGNPQIRPAIVDRRGSARSRRRVAYVGSPLIGARSVSPPLPPDPINLDFQMTVTEILRDLPVEFILRPHPEGLLRGEAHPLAKIHSLESRSFERFISEIDVFVFDNTNSTTFHEALCTDRPIVFIDFGLPVFQKDVHHELEQRCIIVKGFFDARNRLQVDRKELEQAVMDAPKASDPSFFRMMQFGKG